MRTSASDHVFGDRRFRDLESELEQFTMNARGAPQWVLLAHPLDEFTQVTANSGPSCSTSRFPAPIGKNDQQAYERGQEKPTTRAISDSPAVRRAYTRA